LGKQRVARGSKLLGGLIMRAVGIHKRTIPNRNINAGRKREHIHNNDDVTIWPKRGDAMRSPFAANRRRALVEVACVHACERSIISRRRCGEHSTDRALELLTGSSTSLFAYEKSAALHDQDGDTAGEAMVGLARRKDTQVIAPLLAFLQAGNVGSLPLEAAAALGDPVLLPTLQQI
jgi:hypothetical protein